MPTATAETEVLRAEPCSVVLDIDCRAADQKDEKTRARCFACGQSVCTNCSALRIYYDGKPHRLCATCEEDHFQDGAAQVLRRQYHKAGYPMVTLADCRAQLTRPDPSKPLH